MKRVIQFILIIGLIFMIDSVVRADDCLSHASNGKHNEGSQGGISAPCHTSNCANTVGMSIGSYSWNNTAVYGIRLTIMDGNKVKQTRNFWATENMKKAVNSKYVTRLGKTTKDYGNYYVKGNLFNYKNSKGDLHQLDYASATYDDYIKDETNGLSNIDRLNRFLSVFTKKYNSVEKLADKGYRIKVEPIYVLRHYHKKYGTKYYAGTSKEILDKRTTNDLGNVTKLSNWKVIENYLKTVYQDSLKDLSKDNLYAKAGESAGVGYLNITAQCIKRKIKITKLQSNDSSKDNNNRIGDSFSGCAKFQILKKDGNNYKNVTKSVAGDNVIYLGQGCKTPKNSVEYEISIGTYQVKELKDVDGVQIISRYSKTEMGKSKKNSEGTTSNSFTLKTDTTDTVNVTFVNQVKNTNYTIEAHIHQLAFEDSVDWWPTGYEGKAEYYFFKDPDKSNNSKKVCNNYQCYFLCQGNNYSQSCANLAEDYSDRIKDIPTYVGNVTLRLEKKNNNKWEVVKNSQKSVVLDKENNTVKWGVSSKGTYRVVQASCGNNSCGDGKTYVKTKMYHNKDGEAMQGNFRRKMESTAFYVGSSTTTDDPYKVWFINNVPSNENSCESDLAKIKNTQYSSVADLKRDLWNAYRTWNKTKILDFKPGDSITDIQSKVSCSNVAKIDPKPTCEDTKIGDNYNDVSVASYVKGNLSDVLFGDNSVATACYINYDFDFGNNGIIKNNINLYNKSFLWSNNTNSLIGKLKASIHCEGLNEAINTYNAQENIDLIKQHIIESVDEIKLVDDDNKNVQILKLKSVLDKEDYNVKEKNENINSDLEQDEVLDNSTIDDATGSDEGSYLLDETNTDEGDHTSEAEGDDEVPFAFNTQNDGSYYSINIENIDINIVYEKKWYADYLSGTAVETESDNTIPLGWGVPISLNKTSGNIRFKYLFSDSDVGEYFDTVFNIDNIESTCSYKKLQSTVVNDNFKVRFIDTNNPFAGINGLNNRKIGKNWNTCYTSVLNIIGQESEYSYCDLHNCSDTDKDSSKNVYCLYGDQDCDGQFDQLKYKKSINKTQASDVLADINQDGEIDEFDNSLITTWYNYMYSKKGNYYNYDYLKNRCDTYVNEYQQEKTSSDNTNGYDPLIYNNIIKADNTYTNKTPIYSFTLTPATIKEIRNYNNKISEELSCATDESGSVKKDKDGNPICDNDLMNRKINSYLQFYDLECHNGKSCISTFISDLINKKVGFSTLDR